MESPREKQKESCLVTRGWAEFFLLYLQESQERLLIDFEAKKTSLLRGLIDFSTELRLKGPVRSSHGW